MKKHGQIELYQLFFLLVHVQIGVSVLTLPYDVFLVAKGDGWISVILTGLAVQIIIIFICLLIKRFPKKNFFEMAEQIFGKWLGRLISILYIAHFILIAIFIMNKYELIINTWMMPMTPNWVLITIVVLISLYIVTADFVIIARIIVLSSFVFIGYLILGIYALKSANFTFILPVGTSGTSSILKGIYAASAPFVGYGSILIIAPFIKGDSKDLFKVTSLANGVVTLFYLFIVLVCLLFFSPEEMFLVPEPVLYIVKSFTFKVIERPDLLFTAIWVVLVVTSIVLFIYMAAYGIQETFHLRDMKKPLYFCMTLSLLVSISFKGTYDLHSFSLYYEKVLFIFTIIVPLITALYAVLFDKRSEKK